MEPKPIICVSICESGISAVEKAIAEAGEPSDLLEIRLDCLDQSQVRESFQALDDLLAKSQRSTILTYRPVNQGGHHEIDDRNRFNLWMLERQTKNVFLDLEQDLATDQELLDSFPALDWNRVICSFHDFLGMPADLGTLYEQMASTPACILKVAVQANDATDCLPIFALLERARAEGREMIAIAMGEPGIMTRILGPSRGAFLTYASPEDARATAPGQITAQQLRQVYRIEQINQLTEIFGIIGSPISHSLSPRIHNAAFAAADTNAVFIPFEVRDLPNFIRRMVHPRTREIAWNLRGLSVTAPHKVAVTHHLDWIEPTAREIGALNTVLIDEDGLRGHNTDATGFIRPLDAMLGSLSGLRCAVIGTGGAANAAVWALRKEEALVTVFGRNPQRAESLAKRFDVDSRPLEGACFKTFDVVVNATTLGTSGGSQRKTPVSADQLAGARLAYDLVYNPQQTEFLRQAETAGCQMIGGIEMFIAQAEEQFRLWTGSAAVDGVIRSTVERALKKE